LIHFYKRCKNWEDAFGKCLSIIIMSKRRRVRWAAWRWRRRTADTGPAN